MKKIILLAVVFAAGFTLRAQKVWTMQECIDYAKQNNLSVNLQRLGDSLAVENLNTAKAGYYPSVAFSTGQNFSYTNDSEKGVYSGTYGINANMDLYDGGKTYYDIKEKKLSSEIATLKVKDAEHDIELSIIQAYINVLYANEAIKIAEGNLALSDATLSRSKELMKVGSISSVDYSMLESENASYKYQLVSAQNTYSKQLLTLKQLMELKDGIEIYKPEIDSSDIIVLLPDVNTIYEKALSFEPAIIQAEKDKEISELEVKSSYGGYYPTVGISAGVNTGHNSESSLALSKQLQTSLYENVGLNVSIPIYDKRQTKSAVIAAKNQVLVAENNIATVKKDLYKTIDELHLDCLSYQNSYISAMATLASSQNAYELTEQQFNLGLKNIIELLTQRTSMMNAQQSVLQSKYQALMTLKLLDHYQEKEITL